MRWYLGILGLAIFGAGSFMSWGHTATFFADNGFGKGYDPIYGVVVVECLFLMGAGAEIYMRKTGQKSTWSIKLALAVGALTVFWANFRYGLGYGWEGMAAGTIIIVAIVIAENVLADIVLAIQAAHVAKSVQENVQTDGGDVQNVQTDGQTVHKDVHAVQDSVQSVQEPVLEIGGNGQKPVQAVYETAETPAATVQEDVQTDGDDVHAVQKHDGEMTERTEHRLEIGGNDSGHVQDVQSVYETADTPAARLYMYHKENGKLPGRVRLAKMCGMEIRDARRALDRMNKSDTTPEVERKSA